MCIRDRNRTAFKSALSYVPKSNFHSKGRKITLADLKKDPKKSKLTSGNSSGSTFLDQSTLATGGNISADKTTDSASEKALKVKTTENQKGRKEQLKIKIDKFSRPKSN